MALVIQKGKFDMRIYEQNINRYKKRKEYMKSIRKRTWY